MSYLAKVEAKYVIESDWRDKMEHIVLKLLMGLTLATGVGAIGSSVYNARKAEAIVNNELKSEGVHVHVYKDGDNQTWTFSKGSDKFVMVFKLRTDTDISIINKVPIINSHDVSSYKISKSAVGELAEFQKQLEDFIDNNPVGIQAKLDLIADKFKTK